MKKISNLINLKNKNVLVTGALGKLGLAIVETVAELNGNLFLLDLPNKNFDKINNHLRKISNIKIENIKCDLLDKEQINKFITKFKKSKIKLDVLINNAAFVGSSDLEGWNTNFEKQSIDTFEKALNLNLTTAFNLSKGLYPNLKKGKGGSIINISSIYGFLSPDYSLYKGTNMNVPAAYSTSKAGLIQLTRWLASTCAPEVRVNSISPGGILNKQNPKFIKRYNKKTLLGRMGNPEDFKGIIAYLSTNLSSYTTGQNFIIDGGLSIK